MLSLFVRIAQNDLNNCFSVRRLLIGSVLVDWLLSYRLVELFLGDVNCLLTTVLFLYSFDGGKRLDNRVLWFILRL